MVDIIQKGKIPFLLLKRALSIWAKKLHSLRKKRVSPKHYFENSSKFIFHIFRFVDTFHRGSHQNNILNINQNRFFCIFRFLIFFIHSHLSYFRFLLLFCTMGKEIGRFYKHDWMKLSIPTLKKPVLSSSYSRTSSASNSTQTSISSRNDNIHITTIWNKNIILNTDDIQSFVTPQKQNYIVQATSPPTHLASLDVTLSIPSVKFNTTVKLPPAGKTYLCFQINNRSSQSFKCFKSRIMTKVVDYFLSIDTLNNNLLWLKVCYNNCV